MTFNIFTAKYFCLFFSFSSSGITCFVWQLWKYANLCSKKCHLNKRIIKISCFATGLPVAPEFFFFLICYILDNFLIRLLVSVNFSVRFHSFSNKFALFFNYFSVQKSIRSCYNHSTKSWKPSFEDSFKLVTTFCYAKKKIHYLLWEVLNYIMSLNKFRARWTNHLRATCFDIIFPDPLSWWLF